MVRRREAGVAVSLSVLQPLTQMSMMDGSYGSDVERCMRREQMGHECRVGKAWQKIESRLEASGECLGLAT